MPSTPPNGLPVYRLITGKDDASFCQRISEILALGYQLYGSPSVTFDSSKGYVVAAQAVLWPVHGAASQG
ncbi:MULTISPECIES: DUF1737 domain-containing protein [Pseudomonas]|jgi:hypothetical protein|uniref:DUF1737 domain-containing protein n=1 Tax=Pseudomonas carassii TaxID=3115855 RepID=A0ABU7HCD3_9PSED|nr:MULTISPECIES: DUF1737 domain-containing protein [Pseudomonas]MBS9760235.1 DUF1737 domain-containing protein [Pseudomonas mosselii]MCL8298500.1 DUF1737 domain-containing protein [Pseudomonas mosselii]MCL8338301.1 DUF1737 domain-containing protein [Pseudomonas mosselii]MCU9527306.1 DUF1737 domain-containing protein [Pseudomonas mosselii]MCU9534475.1 DUF1737 domain-containing protein [Pseudomonas mosselii]